MEITKETQTGQQNPAAQSHKYYSEQELLNCLKGEHMTVKAVLSLIESNFEKDQAISELTQTVAELTKRISYLEKKTLQKSGCKRKPVLYLGKELTDELLMELIDQG